jgi:hypothetical protein
MQCFVKHILQYADIYETERNWRPAMQVLFYRHKTDDVLPLVGTVEWTVGVRLSKIIPELYPDPSSPYRMYVWSVKTSSQWTDTRFTFMLQFNVAFSFTSSHLNSQQISLKTDSRLTGQVIPRLLWNRWRFTAVFNSSVPLDSLLTHFHSDHTQTLFKVHCSFFLTYKSRFPSRY